jgi:diguanylate cyclase (GGDEF)-like protein/PAS domain S-box-containing protein
VNGLPVKAADGRVIGYRGTTQDITLRRRDQDALRDREQRLAAILGAVADAVIAIDDSGIIRSFNPAAEAIFGWPQRDAVGRNATMLMPEPYASGHQGYLKNYLRTGAPRIIGIGREMVGLRRDGSTFPMALTVTEASLDEPRLFIGIIRDITERKAMEDNLRRLATTDPLTGASNRRHFMDVLAEELARAKRYGHSVALAMIDIDHFKRLNDTYGHAAGDAALIAFVAEIEARLRGSDLLGRLGGEEFAVLIPESSAEEGYILIDALRTARAAVVLEHEGRDIRFTMSAGIADTSHSRTGEGLLAAADAALYRAKHDGRNRVTVAELVPEQG